MNEFYGTKDSGTAFPYAIVASVTWGCTIDHDMQQLSVMYGKSCFARLRTITDCPVMYMHLYADHISIFEFQKLPNAHCMAASWRPLSPHLQASWLSSTLHERSYEACMNRCCTVHMYSTHTGTSARVPDPSFRATTIF